MAGEVHAVQGFAMGLGLVVKAFIGLQQLFLLRLNQALIRVLELYWRIDRGAAGAQIRVHVRGHVSLKILQGFLNVGAVLVGSIHGITQFQHVLVVITQREYADGTGHQCQKEEVPRAYPAGPDPQVM